MKTIFRTTLLALLAGTVLSDAPTAQAGGWRTRSKYVYDVTIQIVRFRSFRRWDGGLDGLDEYTVRWDVRAGGRNYPGADNLYNVDRMQYRRLYGSTTFRNVDPRGRLRFQVSASENRGGVLNDAHRLQSMPVQYRRIGTSPGTRSVWLKNAHYEVEIRYTVRKRRVGGRGRRGRDIVDKIGDIIGGLR